MKSGFTLIELLIVVAIIAILAAIAVPNFLEAQTRAKVSRTKSDLRTAATALEAYYLDNNIYPFDGHEYDTSVLGAGRYNYLYLPLHISTPIAYLSTARMVDPFRTTFKSATNWQVNDVRYYCQESIWGTKYDSIKLPGFAGQSSYYDDTLQEFGGWYIRGNGPDKTVVIKVPGWPGVSVPGYPQNALPHPYDPTNGSISDGDILRSQLSNTGYVNAGG